MSVITFLLNIDGIPVDPDAHDNLVNILWKIFCKPSVAFVVIWQASDGELLAQKLTQDAFVFPSHGVS